MSEEELIEELSSLFNDIENDERYTDTIYRNITKLQQENKQLKKRNKELEDGFKATTDELCEYATKNRQSNRIYKQSYNRMG